MLPAELFLLLSIVSGAAVSLILKLFSDQKGNRYALFLGNYITCVCIALAGIFRQKNITLPGGEVFLLGLISGAFFVAGLICMQTGIRLNGAALTAAFAKLGLIIPLTVSILLFGERPRAFQLIGLLLVFLAIFIIQPPHREAGQEDSQTIFLLPLIAVLFVCGSGDTMIKIFEHTGQGLHLPEFLGGVIVGIPNYFASALLLKALTKFPAFIAYPCYSTGTILLVLIVSSILFGEKIDRRTGAGLAVILAALVILNV